MLATVQAGQSRQFQFGTTIGTPPIGWTDGAAPAWAVIDQNGLLTVSPPDDGSITNGQQFSFTVCANNCGEAAGLDRGNNCEPVTLTVAVGCAPNAVSGDPACETWGGRNIIQSDTAFVLNDAWNLGSFPGLALDQCVDISPAALDGSYTFAASWNYPNPPEPANGIEIIAFPGITFGQRPGYANTGHSGLPVRVTDSQSLAVGYSSQDGEGDTRGWLMSDLRIQKDATQYPNYQAAIDDSTIVYELSIVHDSFGGYVVSPGSVSQTDVLTLDGVTWDFYDRTGASTDAGGTPVRQLTFQPRTFPQTSVDAKALLDWAIANGYAPDLSAHPDAAIVSSVLGVEIERGTTAATGFNVYCAFVNALPN